MLRSRKLSNFSKHQLNKLTVYTYNIGKQLFIKTYIGDRDRHLITVDQQFRDIRFLYHCSRYTINLINYQHSYKLSVKLQTTYAIRTFLFH